MACFPMMIDLRGRRCLVVGGGQTAFRKVQALREFGAKIAVTAPHICRDLEDMPGICVHKREFTEGDLENMFLVVAATSDRELNHEISRRCRERGVLVNAVDQPLDCDFMFPSFIKEGEVVAAFSSSGQCPVLARYLKEKSRAFVTERLGIVSGLLGDLRQDIKRFSLTEEKRRALYESLLSLLLEADDVPGRDAVWEMIEREYLEGGQKDSGAGETAAEQPGNAGFSKGK